jgi:hypothetical protein
MEGLNHIDIPFKKEEVSIVNPAPLLMINHGFEQSIDEIFKRPVVIQTITWSSASTPSSYTPFANWFNDPMILTRLKGRTFVKCDLHLKFDVAASPYHSGLARFCFLYGNAITLNPWTMTDTWASQLYGVDIDLSCPGSKELVIPWIFPREMASVVQNSGDISSIGTLYFVPIWVISRADSVTSGNAAIVVRAWAENMVTAGATRYTAVAQSKNGGIISGTATAFSRAGDALSEVPIIGSFAKTFSKGASLVSNLASFFGFSRERIDSVQVSTKFLSSYSLTDVPVAGQSSSFSKSRARSLDVTPLGVQGSDDMSLSRIFSHPSLLAKIGWTPADIRGAVLRDIVISPLSTLASPTSLAFGVIPFMYWRGSIEFTIRIIASKFHTGTLRVTYEPACSGGAGTEDTTWPVGMTENCIISCTPGATAEIVVNYCHSKFWLPIGDAFYTSTSPATADYVNSLGRLRFLVENPLLAPLSSQGVGIVVSIRGGEDFQVFGIKDTIPRYATYSTRQAPAALIEDGEESESFLAESQSSIVNSAVVSHCEFGGTRRQNVNLTSQIFGEPILSLRALLKRFVPMGYLVATSDANATKLVSKQISASFPMYPTDLSILPGTGNGITYFNYNTLFKYFRLGYLGVRGGMRYRIVDGSSKTDNNYTGTPGVVGPAKFLMCPTYSGVTNLAASATGVAANHPQQCGVGSCLSNENLYQETDFSIPDYDSNLYRSAGPMDAKVDYAYDRGNYAFLVINKEATDMQKCLFFVSCAADEDFSFIFWQGAPPVVITT